MSNLICINNKNIYVKEFNNQRVVTFKEIDELHERPDGTARQAFNRNRLHFQEGRDYFVCQTYEAAQMGYTAPNGMNLITESGYLMLVKPFSDNLSWQVQRQLVDTYFKVKSIDPIMEMMMKDPIMAIRFNQIQMEERLKEAESKQQLFEKRLDNLDTINIEGTEQQRLNGLIRKLSFKEGITFSEAWKRFKKAYNTAYHTNLESLMNYFSDKHGLKKITAPQYLSMSGNIEAALRVADKLLNKAV